MSPALRLLAVYSVTTLVGLRVIHRFVRPISAFAGLAIALSPFLLMGKAMVTGGIYAPMDIVYSAYPLAEYREQMAIGPETRTPLLSDVACSYIPSRKAVRESVRNGVLPLWNRFSMSGEPLLAFQQPAVLHPGTLLGFLLPLAQAWTFDLALRLFLAMLSGYLFFRDQGFEEPESLFGGLGWALSDHLVFFLGFSVTPGLAGFPLLLLGLRRLARGDRAGVGVTVAALVLTILAGHPETVLHVVIGGGVFFLFELVKASTGQRWRAIRLSLASGVLALGLTAVVLIPFAEIVTHSAVYQGRAASITSSRRSIELGESLHVSLRNVLPYAYGVSGHGATAHGYGLPAGYAGSVVLALGLLGLGSRRPEKWIFSVLLFLGWMFWARLIGVVDVAGRLPLLNVSVNEYLVFLGSFGVVGLAVLGVERLRDRKMTGAFAAACLATAVILSTIFVLVYPRLLELEMPVSYLRERFFLQLAPLVLAAVWAMVRRPVSAGRTIWGLVVLLAAQRALEAGEVYPTFPSRVFYPEPGILKAIPRDRPERIAAIGYTLIPDGSALFELEDVRGYEALTLARLVQTYPLWCVGLPAWFNRVDDPTRPFLAFLNVRYVVAAPHFAVPAGWTVLSADPAGKVLENPRALARAFAPARLANLRNSAQRLAAMSSISDFARDGVIEEGPPDPGGEPRWRPNGKAGVRIESYRADRIVLTVRAASPALVATSIPLWPGWRITSGDRRLAAIPYNNAFLSFRVPAGTHVVRLRYWPDGVTVGLALTTTTFVTVLLLLLFRRRGAFVPRTEECPPG